ncbi:ABC transporter G family member 6-like [Telopea speciosissima]|uniref:ABC transporter G family member 6-like n=1 Tax=Telopea speciosissima TaxID=54955 RepID=UPI001CC338C3|nr:ABC transporter G family member 6-like [Telopea speciosissima]
MKRVGTDSNTTFNPSRFFLDSQPITFIKDDQQQPMEVESLSRNPNSGSFGVSPTLGELLKRVGDVQNGNETPNHQVLEMTDGGLGLEPRSLPLPFVLSFSNLTYSIKNRRKMRFPNCFGRTRSKLGAAGDPVLESDNNNYSSNAKIILNDISGEARDGEILAVLGASGSGKSTLIDALANRMAKGSLKGSITLNGEPLESRLLKVISAYVMQDDLLFPMLTVEETLMFSAEFRLPRSLSKSKKKARVQALIDQLGLRNAAKTVIGDEGHRGVSGGERRRVSIGTDIIHDPIILFLDEPTSGLDSTSAFMVVKVLQRIAQSGSIVIMSIHQPSYRIIGLLDRMIFLSRGQTVFRGPPSTIPQFFAEFGHPIPEKENRTEFALDLIRELEVSPGGTKGLVEFQKSWQTAKRPGNLDSQQQDLSLNDAISASISRGKLVSGTTNDSSSTKVSRFVNPFWAEIAVLSKRSVTNTRRMPELLGIRLGAVLVTGFILATIFWHLDNSPKGVQERLGFFAFAMSTTFYTCADALPVFLQERYIFMRETAYNAYRRSSYVLSNSIVVIPSLIFLSFAFAATTFWAVGLAGGVKGFFFYFGIILASFWAGSSFVTFLSGVVSHVMLGYTVVVAILAYFLLFSGFFINRDRIPDYWLWFHYMSLVKYPYEGVLQNEFQDPTKCFVRGVQMFDNTPLEVAPTATKVMLLQSLSSTLGINITSTTCVTTGTDILIKQGVTDLSKWNCLWVTIAWGFFFRILFYFALLLGSKNKRK